MADNSEILVRNKEDENDLINECISNSFMIDSSISCDSQSQVIEFSDCESKFLNHDVTHLIDKYSSEDSEEETSVDLNQTSGLPDSHSISIHIPNISSENVEEEKEYAQESSTEAQKAQSYLPNQNFVQVTEQMKELETKNSVLEKEISDLKLKLKAQEISSKQAELQVRAEFLDNFEKLSKECNTLRKEKEAMVIRYANSEKDVIMEKKAQQELERKLKELIKERDVLLGKIKSLIAENNKITTCYENKMVEIARLEKNVDKLNDDFNSREIKIKWLQNKLKVEISSHEETQAKLAQTVQRLNEMKEEAEQIRKDCQEMIRCYQEAEETKSVKLDGQLKQKLSELEIQNQEKCDQEQIYHLLRQELEALKKNQRMTMEENNALTLKIQILEKERLEYEQNLSRFKDSQNMSKQEIVDLNARLAEMETLQLQLEREKEKSAASLREVERLRSTNAELQADMNACHVKEGELLKFTEGVTDTNVKLQSAHSLLEIKAQALENEMTETKKLLSEMQQKYTHLNQEMDNLKIEHENEVQLLARKVAEKTKNVEKLNVRIEEAENENRVLKRRHIASIKELSRELYECKKRLDSYETSYGVRTDSASLGSRCSSTASLDVLNSNERLCAMSPSPTSLCFNGKKSATPPKDEDTSAAIPEIDKEMLIERIIKLQKQLARKNDKIDFLEDHIVQLVKEMRKKSKTVDFKPV